MNIAVISDTHDDLAATRKAVEIAIAHNAEAIIHCGDLASPDIVQICSQLPLYFVFGNHDADVVPELQQAANACRATCLGWGGAIILAGKRIAVAHGHMTSDLRPLLESKPDYLFTGHAHEHSDRHDGETRRICPGALFRADPLTFALVDLQSGAAEFVTLT